MDQQISARGQQELFGSWDDTTPRRPVAYEPAALPAWWWLEIADNRHRAKLPENQSNIALLGHNDMLING